MIPALLPMFWDSFLSKQLQMLVPKPWILMKFAVLATLGALIWVAPQIFAKKNPIFFSIKNLKINVYQVTTNG